MTLNIGMAYSFLVARGSRPGAAAGFASVFLFASVIPVYFVWLTPELFNFTLVLECLLLVELQVGRRRRMPTPGVSLERFLRSPRSDYVAAMLLGIATFSKPTHILLMLPIGGMVLFERRLRHLVAIGVCFSVVVAGLFALNAATSGEFNYQGGERRPFIGQTGFPFANTWETFDNRGVSVCDRSGAVATSSSIATLLPSWRGT